MEIKRDTYDNWLKGKFSTDLSLIENANIDIPKEELEKIKIDQKRIYNAISQKTIAKQIKAINETVSLISNKDYYVSELQNYLRQSISEKFDPFDDLKSTYSHILNYKGEYKSSFKLLVTKYFETDERDYSVISKPIKYYKEDLLDVYLAAELYVKLHNYLKNVRMYGVRYIQKIEKEYSNEEFKFKTYKWNSNKEKSKTLIKLWDKLTYYQFIDGKSSVNDFIEAFSGETIERKLKIIWIKRLEDYGAFILLLIHYKIISSKNYDSITTNSHLFYYYTNEGSQPKTTTRITNVKQRYFKDNNVNLPSNDKDLQMIHKIIKDVFSLG